MNIGRAGETRIDYCYPGVRLLSDEDLRVFMVQAGAAAKLEPDYFFEKPETAPLERPLIFKCKKCGSAHTIEACPECRNRDFSRGTVQTKPPYAGLGVFCSNCGLGGIDFRCQKCAEIVAFQSSLHVLRQPIIKKESCFIATAAFGSASAPQVEVLRQFRDAWLLNRSWGARTVRAYYRHSPVFAEMIRNRATLRWLIRVGLLCPMVGLVSRLLRIPAKPLAEKQSRIAEDPSQRLLHHSAHTFDLGGEECDGSATDPPSEIAR
jgi:hypothetical protein